MRGWRPALRMARRDLRRHRARALLTCLLVMLPVVAATVAALGAHNSSWDRERGVTEQMGAADAVLVVSDFTSVRPKAALTLWPRPAKTDSGRATRRDPESVDVAALLPEGSRVVPATAYGSVPLSSGGQADAVVVDPTTPMTDPHLQLAAGREPRASDEIAISAVAADELGLVDADGSPLPDAAVVLGDDTRLRVVGTADRSLIGGNSTLLYGVPGSLLAGSADLGPADGQSPQFYVDLPDLDREQLKALAGDAAAAGVMLRPRDAGLNPQAWGLGDDGLSMDVTPLVVGALCILVGTIEVVLLVGAAFAVAARRQVRDLGLLAANGGAAPDLRRVLLAQGVVLGIGSSLVGLAVGIGSFFWLLPLWEQLFGQGMWRQEVSWPTILVIGLLGSLTSVAAALLPAWNVARLTPVAALSGRFPIRAAESKAHRGAFVLMGSGLGLLVLGGWLTARTFGPHGRENPAAAYLAGLGLVVLVSGAVWGTPYVVRRVAALGSLLSLSGRYAFRDAARHRFRTSAAVMALMVTVAGAVLAGFGFRSATRAYDATVGYDLPHSLELSIDLAGNGESIGYPASADRAVTTVERVVGPVRRLESSMLVVAGRPNHPVGLVRGPELRQVDETTLLRLLEPGQSAVLQAFRDGAVVLVSKRSAEAEEVGLRVPARRGAERRTMSAVQAEERAGLSGIERGLGQAFVSPETAADLGLEAAYGNLLLTAGQAITRDDLERLQVYGLYAYSSDPDRAVLQGMQFAGLLAAGLVSLLVVGVAVALAAAESRDEVATLAAVGAGPWRRRSFGAMHGLFLGLVATLLGLGIGVPAGVALTQLDGLPGIDMAWLPTIGTVAVVFLSAPVAGWLVTPSRLRMTRRTA